MAYNTYKLYDLRLRQDSPMSHSSDPPPVWGKPQDIKIKKIHLIAAVFVFFDFNFIQVFVFFKAGT